MATERIPEQLRLIIQASIPVASPEEGDVIYSELKVFLLAWCKGITLNGQIMKMLEPCCKKKPEAKDHAKDT